MRCKYEKDSVYKPEKTLNNVGLQVEDLNFNKEEVLCRYTNEQDYLDSRKHSEWDCSRDDDNDLIDSQCDLLRSSQKEVLELGTIEDEKDHRE